MQRLELHSNAFHDGEPIPVDHTDDGANRSPALGWSEPPPGTREFVLIVDDPDAPTPKPWVHWVLYGIPADCRGLPEGVPAVGEPLKPRGSRQGKNSFGKLGYGGPAPPRGHGVHHYHFRLYAIDAPLNYPVGREKEQVLAGIKAHILAEGHLVGTYERR
jgi:Raf kinase inhibitor-like YbhB/YbcL family protein